MIRHVHCMWKQLDDNIDRLGGNIPPVCSSEPLHQSAFCQKHGELVQNLGWPSKLREFLLKCGTNPKVLTRSQQSVLMTSWLNCQNSQLVMVEGLHQIPPSLRQPTTSFGPMQLLQVTSPPMHLQMMISATRYTVFKTAITFGIWIIFIEYIYGGKRMFGTFTPDELPEMRFT